MEEIVMKARKYQTRKLREQWYVHLDRFKHQKRRYILLGEKKKKKGKQVPERWKSFNRICALHPHLFARESEVRRRRKMQYELEEKGRIKWKILFYFIVGAHVLSIEKGITF